MATQALRPCGLVYNNCCPFEICLCHQGFLMLHRKLETCLLRFDHAGPELWRNREWSWVLEKWNENSSLWHWDSSPYWWRKELSLCTCVSVELCAADTKCLQHLLMIASRRKKISFHWLWNSKCTALCSSSCSIHRQNIFWVCGYLTKIPIPQSQLWAQNVSAFTYSFRNENRKIPVQASGLWKLTKHCPCEESLNDARGTG